MASSPVFQVTEGDWTSEKFVDVLGVKISAFFTPDPQLLCDFITNFETRPDDVFVVTYPKSGEAIFDQILRGHDTSGTASVKLRNSGHQGCVQGDNACSDVTVHFFLKGLKFPLAIVSKGFL